MCHPRGGGDDTAPQVPREYVAFQDSFCLHFLSSKHVVLIIEKSWNTCYLSTGSTRQTCLLETHNHIRSQGDHTYDNFLEAIGVTKITPSKIQPVPHCHRRLSRKTGQRPVQYDEMVKHQNGLRAYLEHFHSLGCEILPRP